MSQLVEGKITVNTATIAAGASLSGSVEIGDAKYVGVIMPAAWTSASMTFQVSADNSTWVNLTDASGEVAITVAASGGYKVAADIQPFQYIKVRSGTAASAVNQEASRTITIVGKG